MLWSLRILYILFAGKIKAKINTNIFAFETFIFYVLSFVKFVPTLNI